MTESAALWQLASRWAPLSTVRAGDATTQSFPVELTNVRVAHVESDSTHCQWTHLSNASSPRVYLGLDGSWSYGTATSRVCITASLNRVATRLTSAIGSTNSYP